MVQDSGYETYCNIIYPYQEDDKENYGIAKICRISCQELYEQRLPGRPRSKHTKKIFLAGQVTNSGSPVQLERIKISSQQRETKAEGELHSTYIARPYYIVQAQYPHYNTVQTV